MSSLRALLALTSLVVLFASGCGPCGRCPSGTHCNPCAHGSCDVCDDCVPECVPD